MSINPFYIVVCGRLSCEHDAVDNYIDLHVPSALMDTPSFPSHGDVGVEWTRQHQRLIGPFPVASDPFGFFNRRTNVVQTCKRLSNVAVFNPDRIYSKTSSCRLEGLGLG